MELFIECEIILIILLMRYIRIKEFSTFGPKFSKQTLNEIINEITLFIHFTFIP